jgi:hypothetical protein
LWAWETVRPTTGPLSQISHRLAIKPSMNLVPLRRAPGKTNSEL